NVHQSITLPGFLKPDRRFIFQKPFGIFQQITFIYGLWQICLYIVKNDPQHGYYQPDRNQRKDDGQKVEKYIEEGIYAIRPRISNYSPEWFHWRKGMICFVMKFKLKIITLLLNA